MIGIISNILMLVFCLFNLWALYRIIVLTEQVSECKKRLNDLNKMIISLGEFNLKQTDFVYELHKELVENEILYPKDEVISKVNSIVLEKCKELDNLYNTILELEDERDKEVIFKSIKDLEYMRDSVSRYCKDYELGFVSLKDFLNNIQVDFGITKKDLFGNNLNFND